MTNAIGVRLAFDAPAGMSGLLQLQHDGHSAGTALLMIEMAHPHGARLCAPLTAADIRLLVGGLMDALNCIERRDRLSDRV